VNTEVSIFVPAKPNSFCVRALRGVEGCGYGGAVLGMEKSKIGVDGMSELMP
jgi:hypothetical protein